MRQTDIVTGLDAVRVARVKALISALKAELAFLIQLTAEERQSANAVAEGRLPFVQASTKAAINYATELLLTPDMVAKIERISYDFEAMSEINHLMESLAEAIADTTMYIGSHCYNESRLVRDMTELAIKRGVPGMETVYEELSTPWERSSKPKSNGNGNGSSSNGGPNDQPIPGPEPV